MLQDRDRIFTNLYGLHSPGLQAAKMRGAWDGTKFLLEKGQIDRIVPRAQMRDELARLLAYATGRDPVAAYKPIAAVPEPEPVAVAAVEGDKKAKKKAKKDA